jgi:hypothetical protein
MVLCDGLLCDSAVAQVKLVVKFVIGAYYRSGIIGFSVHKNTKTCLVVS